MDEDDYDALQSTGSSDGESSIGGEDDSDNYEDQDEDDEDYEPNYD